MICHWCALTLGSDVVVINGDEYHATCSASAKAALTVQRNQSSRSSNQTKEKE